MSCQATCHMKSLTRQTQNIVARNQKHSLAKPQSQRHAHHDNILLHAFKAYKQLRRPRSRQQTGIFSDMAEYNFVSLTGWRLKRGKTTSRDLQNCIVQEILLLGDPVTGNFSPFREVAEKFRFSDQGIRKLWRRFVSCKPIKGNRGSYPKLKDGDI